MTLTMDVLTATVLSSVAVGIVAGWFRGRVAQRVADGALHVAAGALVAAVGYLLWFIS